MSNWTGLSASKFIVAVVIGLILSLVFISVIVVGSNYKTDVKPIITPVPTQNIVTYTNVSPNATSIFNMILYQDENFLISPIILLFMLFIFSISLSVRIDGPILIIMILFFLMACFMLGWIHL